ncbi:MAG: T9SS type A sorting domain-containing protein [Weeksellaceae bacterium]|nr:T9SS type A sorting domain-containing protein [Weeksellaceae bacterium]
MKPQKLLLLFLCSLLNAQEIQWDITLGGAHSEYISDLLATPDFGFLIAGSTFSGKTGSKETHSQGDLDFLLLKLDDNGKTQWQKSWGGTGTDQIATIQLTQDGGILLAGTSNSGKSGDKLDGGYGKEDFWLIQLDPQGEQLWQMTIGGEGSDIMVVAKQTKDGGIILMGNSDSEKHPMSNDIPWLKAHNSYGGMDIWVVKLDSNGEIQWQRTLGGNYNDIAVDIIENQNKDFIILATSNSTESGNKTSKNYGSGDYWVIKLDREGNEIWQKTFGGDKEDQAVALLLLENDDILMGGFSSSTASGNKTTNNEQGTDYWLLRITDNAEVIWQKNYNTGYADVLKNMHKTYEGNILLSGTDFHTIEEDQNYVVTKIDDQGNELWSRTLGGNGRDVLTRSIMTREGAYILAGTSTSTKSADKKSGKQGREDLWIIKLFDSETKNPLEVAKVVEIYPNPVDKHLTLMIHKDFDKAEMQLYDMAGRQLWSQKIDHKQTIIDMHRYQTGLYVVKLVIDNEKYNEKIIKR